MCCRCSSIVLTALFLLLYTETCAGQDRFGLDSAQVKGTNNSGGGDSALWGSRNLRVVLKNILYRGGGNNFHLKPSDPQSFIRNPLPLQGIRRLHETGFGSAWYLYATNFETQYPPERLDSLRRAGFEYECHPSLTDKVVVDFMVSIREMILSPNPKPMYIHCWNGWHQSGMLSAFTLMQFCGLSNQQALKYWEQNTDGNYRGYAAVKSRILNYVSDSTLHIPDSIRTKICPCFTNDVIQAKEMSFSEIKKEGEKGSAKNMEAKSHSTNTGGKSRYTIRRGDTLSLIAKRNNTTVKKLCSLNGIKETKVLQIGEQIRVN
jgi:LysM repeat protein